MPFSDCRINTRSAILSVSALPLALPAKFAVARSGEREQMPKGSRANIALWWYAKTPQGWRHYPCIWEKAHGVNQPKHGWVKYKEEAIEFPIGRYELRTFEDGRRVYKPLETCHPREAAMALARARRVADNIGAHNPYHRISTAIAEYLRDLRQRRKPVMEKKARPRRPTRRSRCWPRPT